MTGTPAPLLAGLFCLPFLVGLGAGQTETAAPQEDRAALLARTASGSIGKLVAEVLAESNAPALGAAYFTKSGQVELGVAGLRRVRGKDAVQLGDAWHLGSCTKALTAVLAERLVQKKQLQWDTTAASVLVTQGPTKTPPLYGATLEQLLQHRGGFKANFSRLESAMEMASRQHRIEPAQRLASARAALDAKPEYLPGEGFLYSNLGYTVAGAMIEARGQSDYRSLLTREVLAPRGVKGAVFGPPGYPEGADQAIWGHRPARDSWFALDPKSGADNPALITPAGRLSLPLAEWVKTLTPWLDPAADVPGFPSPAARKHMTSPPAGRNYAHGWLVVDRDWGGGKVLTHTGSNNSWFCVVWLAPEKGFGVLATTNVASKTGPRLTDRMVSRLIKRFAP